MSTEFVDLQIIGLDDARCRKSGTAPFMYCMYLMLSGNPPLEWQQLFFQERELRQHRMWRHVWIEHYFIVVNCIPEEIERCHLRELKEDVKKTNEKYRLYLSQREKEGQMKGEAERKDRERLRALGERLDFYRYE